MEIVVESLRHPDEGEIQILQSIYEDNFPASERRPFTEILDQVATSKYLLIIARRVSSDETEAFKQIIGLAILTILPESHAAFLEYIAVEKAYQNQKVGSKLFEATLVYLKNDASILIWEVELPTPDDESIENRRIRWYKRLGAQFLDDGGHYKMPDFYDEASSGVPLRLMIAYTSESTQILAKKQVATIISDIYSVAYRGYEKQLDEILSAFDKN